MAGPNLIRAPSQIMAGTITAALFVTPLNLPTSQLADSAKIFFADGSKPMTASINLGGFTGQNAATPVNATDVANKSYVDAKVAGFQIHFARVMSSSNVSSLSGLGTYDGVTVAAGDRIFLPNQTTGSQNGLWVAASGSWTRPTDWPSAGALPEGQYVILDPDGTTYKNTKWFCTTTGTITVDTTATTFSQDLSGTVYSAGSGISLTGATFAAKLGLGLGFDGSSNIQVVPDPSRLLQATSNGVGIKDGTAGQLLMANSSGNASYQTLSGDATISSAGALTLASTVLKYARVVINEVPGGSINGTNTSYTLANTPATEPAIYLNGQRKLVGSGNDYTRSGSTITWLTALLSGDQLLADYTF